MRNIYRSLLLLIAGATQKELARLPRQVHITPQERNRLVRFGAKLGRALNELVTIVHPDTLRRWIRESRRGRQSMSRGRRRTAADVRKLIIKLARENGWGYTRILGEIKKLGIKSVSRNTVEAILKSEGLDPGPKRGVGTWDEFLKLHAATLWQCDFFSKKVLTPKGFRDLFVLVFLHAGTRRVVISPASYHPNEAWGAEQAKTFVAHVAATGLGAEIVMHDRDSKFTAAFDAVLKQSNLRVQKSPFRSPNTVAFVERFIQTIQQECLDHFVVFGQQHMDHLCSEFVEHYHVERPHQGKENELLQPVGKAKRGSKAKTDPATTILLRDIRCRKRLGGLLKHYYREAA